ncbi:MAG: putative ribosome biogenesis GTPase RsgA [Chlamydiae bacterium]|nr:putative ribosome biogenesis GTPase RsgA [Chlamydiota bacterium]
MDKSKGEKSNQNNHPKRWVACLVEEEYFGDDRKASRIERKRLSAKDRSKYKKTDYKKFEESFKQEVQSKLANKKLFRGRALSITSQGITVDLDGETYTCAVRGLLKKEKTRVKNLVAVGDFVLFEKAPDHEGIITDVEPRTSTLSRADNLSRRKEQVLAANIDQVLITVSVISPLLKPFLIDRYIIAAQKGNMKPVVLINKVDLLEDETYDKETREQRKLLQECQEAYAKAEIALIPISAKTGEGLDQLRKAMKGKASVFSGQSGTGKSSLINAITGLNLPVKETVRKTRKGAHTTTRAHLQPLEFGGWCIDTPGIKSFGVWDLKDDQLEQYFSEICEYSHQCKFPNCSHIHEQECAVLENLKNGKISPLRYDSYQALMESIHEIHRRR